MAVTYTATPLGQSSTSLRSAVRNVLVSLAAGASEALTLVHFLGGVAGTGACPTEIRVALRSVAVCPSGVLNTTPVISAMNASQAVINFGTPNGLAQSIYVDIIAEFTHSIVS